MSKHVCIECGEEEKKYVEKAGYMLCTDCIVEEYDRCMENNCVKAATLLCDGCSGEVCSYHGAPDGKRCYHCYEDSVDYEVEVALLKSDSVIADQGVHYHG